MPIATDQEMLQSLLAIAADVVDDRLCTARERKSPAVSTFLFLSDAAGDGKERACDLAGIAAGALGLAMNFSKCGGVECWCVERKARIDGEGVPTIAEAPCTQ